jgi:hypothetical protein
MRKLVILFLVFLIITGTFALVSANGGGSDDSGSGNSGSDDSGGGNSGNGNSGSDDSGSSSSGSGNSGSDDSNRGGSGRSGEAEAEPSETVTSRETGAAGTVTVRETETISTTATVTGVPTEDDREKGEGRDDSKGTEVTNLQVKVKETTDDRHTDVTVLKIKLKEKMNETELEIHSAGIKDQQVIQNQTSLLAGIQALQLVNELAAEYGSNITEIEAGLEDSLNATTLAEVRIKDRNQVIRFFTGGDDAAARQIEREIDRNQDRIQEMQQLIDQCNCSQELKDVLHDQIREMEQEQDRLRDLAQNELEDKGLIGWIWK